MKKLVPAPLLALFAALSSLHAFAQGLVLDPGFTATNLLPTVQAAIAGFDFDSSGNLYYIGPFDSDPDDTQLVEASAASGYSSSKILIDYGASTYASFLTVHGSSVYYGDSANGGNINAASLPITAAQTPSFFGNSPVNMPDNYDLAFSGTTAFVSANVSGTSNEILALNVNTRVQTKILDTDGDYSGPIAFTANGSLLYGESGAAGKGGIYLFTAAEVNAAVTSGTAMPFSDGQLIVSNAGNSDFAVVGNDLFQAFDPLSGSASLTLYNLSTLTSTPIATVDNQGYYFSAIEALNGDLVVAETDGYSITNIYQIAAIPEPSAPWLAGAGLALLLTFHRRRKSKAAKAPATAIFISTLQLR